MKLLKQTETRRIENNFFIGKEFEKKFTECDWYIKMTAAITSEMRMYFQKNEMSQRLVSFESD